MKKQFLICKRCGKEFAATEATAMDTREAGVRYHCPKCGGDIGYIRGAAFHKAAKHGLGYRISMTLDAVPAEMRNSEYNLKIAGNSVVSPAYKNLSGVKSAMRSWNGWTDSTEWHDVRITAYMPAEKGVTDILKMVSAVNWFETIEWKVDHGKVYLTGTPVSRNVNELFHSANLLGELVTIANKWAGNGKIAGGIKKMASIVRKYDDGKADCQKAARNTKE